MYTLEGSTKFYITITQITTHFLGAVSLT